MLMCSQEAVAGLKKIKSAVTWAGLWLQLYFIAIVVILLQAHSYDLCCKMKKKKLTWQDEAEGHHMYKQPCKQIEKCSFGSLESKHRKVNPSFYMLSSKRTDRPLTFL